MLLPATKDSCFSWHWILSLLLYPIQSLSQADQERSQQGPVDFNIMNHLYVAFFSCSGIHNITSAKNMFSLLVTGTSTKSWMLNVTHATYLCNHLDLMELQFGVYHSLVISMNSRADDIQDH